jgi:hypothetical protein
VNIFDVMREIADNIRSIPKLGVYDYSADSVTVPCAVVSLPEAITFDVTYGRGSDRARLEIMVLEARLTDRSSSKRIVEYANAEGTRSIKAAVDSSTTREYSSCDDVHVVSCEFDIVRISGTDYLGCIFTVEIEGPGKVRNG